MKVWGTEGGDKKKKGAVKFIVRK